ncbi:MFS transporter [Dongia mobilis]|nr:MFS transporter [Dongia mobilis]
MAVGRRRWLLLGLLSAAMLPIAIDSTILYIAAPSLAAGLQPSARELLWILDLYSLLLAGLVIATGPLGDIVGHRRLLLAGLLLFGMASLAAASAPSPALLIAARGLLACGGAMIVPATLSIIRQVFVSDKERAIAIGVWGGVASGGTALGPLVGGVLLEHFWWGSVFLINLPVVAVLMPLLARYLGRHAPLGPAQRPPLWPAILGIAGVIGLAYALKVLATEPDAPAVLVGIAGLAFLGVFARSQWRDPNPLLDLRLLAARPVVAGALAAFLPFLVLAGFELALAQQLQSVMGLSPLAAAWFLLPMPLSALVMGPLGGRLIGQFGARAILAAALVTAGGGYLALGAYDLVQVLWAAVLTLTAIGGGHGVAMMAASHAIMSGAPPARAGSAASIESVVFELGTGFGIAIFGSLLGAMFLQRMGGAGGATLPPGTIGEALAAAASMEEPAATMLREGARRAFAAAFDVSAMTAGATMLAGAALLFRLTPKRT